VKRLAVAASALVLAGLATGCAGPSSQADEATPHLRVSGAYVPQPPLADMAAGYLTVTNSGRAADRLTGVTSDLSANVSMHTTTASGQMQPVVSLTIPAGGRLVLHTGADHLMLMKLQHKPVVGDTVTFTLRFATSPPITVRAPVKPATYQPGR
jgi:periplasmic copper chaperone A